MLLSALSPTALGQGETGFTRGAGKLDTVLTFSQDRFDEFFLGPSPFAPVITGVQRQIYSLYAAYGVTDRVDLIANLAWVDAQADAEQFLISDESDLQDLTLSVKARVAEWRVGPGNFTVAALPGVKLPVGDYASFEDNAINAPGHRQVDLRARLVAQYQLDSGNWFALEGGYDRRNGIPADEIPINATLGINVAQRVTLTPFYSFVTSNGEADLGLATSGVAFDRYGLGAYVPVSDGLGITANYRRTDEGRNESEGFSVGLVFRF